MEPPTLADTLVASRRHAVLDLSLGVRVLVALCLASASILYGIVAVTQLDVALGAAHLAPAAAALYLAPAAAVASLAFAEASVAMGIARLEPGRWTRFAIVSYAALAVTTIRLTAGASAWPLLLPALLGAGLGTLLGVRRWEPAEASGPKATPSILQLILSRPESSRRSTRPAVAKAQPLDVRDRRAA